MFKPLLLLLAFSGLQQPLFAPFTPSQARGFAVFAVAVELVSSYDQEVADEAARLSLTGISTGWKVKQTDTGDIWQYNGAGAEADAGCITSGIGIGDGAWKNDGTAFNGHPVFTSLTIVEFLVNYDPSHGQIWIASNQPNDTGSQDALSDTDADFPWNADWTTANGTVTRDDVAGTANWTNLGP